MICLGIIALFLALAYIAPLLFGPWTEMVDYEASNLGPSWRHPLGTDYLGRDLLIKTIYGARVSLSVALVTNFIAVPLGILLGALAGYFGKWVDDGIVWLFSTLAAIPGIIRIIAIKFAFSGIGELWIGIPRTDIGFSIDLAGMAGIYVALAMSYWIGTCRLVRAETLKLRDQDFVLAARAAGRGRVSILNRHILPNVMHLGVIQFSLGLVGAIMAEVMLSFLGLGAGPESPSWGRMISAGQQSFIAGRYMEFTAAVVAMFILVLALNLFGDRLRDALDPKLKRM
jgi:ABC-type dipeptide/oligopeptide/nickel transport system permease subunit